MRGGARVRKRQGPDEGAAALRGLARKKGQGPVEENPLEGRYANFVRVGFNAFEFLLDFGQYLAETKHVQKHTRIIASPPCAKVLLAMLRQSVEAYEQSYGPIAGERIEDLTEAGQVDE